MAKFYEITVALPPFKKNDKLTGVKAKTDLKLKTLELAKTLGEELIAVKSIVGYQVKYPRP